MNDDQEGEDPQVSESTGDSELDRQVADLEHKRDKVANRIEKTRSDWEAKKDDPSVPGAMADPADQASSGEPSDAVEEDSAERTDEAYEWVDPETADEDDRSDDQSHED